MLQFFGQFLNQTSIQSVLKMPQIRWPLPRQCQKTQQYNFIDRLHWRVPNPEKCLSYSGRLDKWNCNYYDIQIVYNVLLLRLVSYAGVSREKFVKTVCVCFRQNLYLALLHFDFSSSKTVITRVFISFHFTGGGGGSMQPSASSFNVNETSFIAVKRKIWGGFTSL